MKGIYEIKNLGCASCAAKIEARIGELEGVNEAIINFSTSKLHLNYAGEIDDHLLEEINAIIGSIESGAYLEYEKETRKVSKGKKGIYEIKNLGCASCAAKIEAAVADLDGVNESVIDFSTSKLHINYAGEISDSLLEEINQIVGSIESGAYLVYEKESKKSSKQADEKSDEGKFLLVKLIVPILVFLGSFLVKNQNIKLGMLVFSYVISGADIIETALKNIVKGQVFDENFLMTIASLGAISIGEFSEGVAVMVFYSIGEYFQNQAVKKSRKSISDLMDIKVTVANLEKDGKIIEVDPGELKISDRIVVKPGERIPVDGRVLEGETSIDTSALTGESLPQEISEGSEVLSGSVNLNSTITVEVLSLYEDSAVSKILKLVEESGAKKAPTERFITRFSRIYTPVVVISALILAVVFPIVLGDPFSKWIYRALVFLVASCPCALVVSIPLGFFAGIGRLSKDGVIVKGANHIEDMAQVKQIGFDKTGTLTKGSFVVEELVPAVGVGEYELLKAAAITESMSNHPIAFSIREKFNEDIPRPDSLEDIAGHGIVASIDGSKIYVGNGKLMEKFDIAYEENDSIGTTVYVAVDDKYLGSLIVNDEIKEESASLIRNLHKEGIGSLMLTGDKEEVAREVAGAIGIDHYEAGLLPQDKVSYIEKMMAKNEGKLAFVGDGINDAPVLIVSDVGIAMGQVGSDAAIEAADVVIMEDDLTTLPKLTRISKQTMKIVRQNIIFALAFKVLVLILGALGIANMWLAVFADTGVALLAILNSVRILRMK